MSKQALENIFQNKEYVEKVAIWHQKGNLQYSKALDYCVEELVFHKELLDDKKYQLLINIEYLKTYKIRQKSLNGLPDWINSETLAIDYENLDELWLKPTEGYLVRHLKASKDPEDKKRLERVLQSKSYKYRGLDKTVKERKTLRLQKLQESIKQNKVVIFLGRQNRIYKNLQKMLNEKYEGQIHFISDHIWSSSGYIEPGVKASDNRLSLIQACETIRRMNNLDLECDSIIEKRFIMFTLDGYDMKHCLAAIYSNPNRIQRNYPKPQIEGIEKFEFAYTGLTDLELANIVRNKDWFQFLRFCKTSSSGELEELSQKQVQEEYGIKYIGDKLNQEL